jgi:cytochrome c oxidase assembly factor CtaG
MVIMRQDTAQQNVLLDMHMMELLDVWLIVPRLIIMGIPYSEIKRTKNVQLTAQIHSHMVTQQQDIAIVHAQ